MRRFLTRRVCASRLMAGLLLSVSLWFAPSAGAQWTTQTISLRSGWNAVYLEIQPEQSDCDVLLAGLPIETVWRWNRRFSSVQFIQDPNQLIREPDAWLVWIPANHPAAGRSTLFILEGGVPYLIKST